MEIKCVTRSSDRMFIRYRKSIIKRKTICSVIVTYCINTADYEPLHVGYDCFALAPPRGRKTIRYIGHSTQCESYSIIPGRYVITGMTKGLELMSEYTGKQRDNGRAYTLSPYWFPLREFWNLLIRLHYACKRQVSLCYRWTTAVEVSP